MKNRNEIKTNFRLFLLELTKGDEVTQQMEGFKELIEGNVQMPFSFGNIDWTGIDPNT